MESHTSNIHSDSNRINLVNRICLNSAERPELTPFRWKKTRCHENHHHHFHPTTNRPRQPRYHLRPLRVRIPENLDSNTENLTYQTNQTLQTHGPLISIGGAYDIPTPKSSSRSTFRDLYSCPSVADEEIRVSEFPAKNYALYHTLIQQRQLQRRRLRGQAEDEGVRVAEPRESLQTAPDGLEEDEGCSSLHVFKLAAAQLIYDVLNPKKFKKQLETKNCNLGGVVDFHLSLTFCTIGSTKGSALRYLLLLLTLMASTIICILCVSLGIELDQTGGGEAVRTTGKGVFHWFANFWNAAFSVLVIIEFFWILTLVECIWKIKRVKRTGYRWLGVLVIINNMVFYGLGFYELSGGFKVTKDWGYYFLCVLAFHEFCHMIFQKNVVSSEKFTLFKFSKFSEKQSRNRRNDFLLLCLRIDAMIAHLFFNSLLFDLIFGLDVWRFYSLIFQILDLDLHLEPLKTPEESHLTLHSGPQPNFHCFCT